jgi:Mg2+ and Co2+ transporters
MDCYQISEDALVKTEADFEGGAVCVCTADELRAHMHPFAPHTIDEYGRTGPSKLEAYDGYDFILLNVVNAETRFSTHRIALYVTRNQIVFVSDGPSRAVREVLDAFCGAKTANLNLTRVLYGFFNHLTDGDSQELEQFEDEISALEERIMEDKDGDYVRDIMAMRKKLMFYKKYYEQLLDVAESIEENENGLLPPNALRYFKMFTSRVDRLNHHVLNLRDYITQVREAYQSQVDIKLNEIMKLFTVVTVIFLPLTLLVGWYGMNFRNMPELQWPYGYAVAIVLSVLFVVVSVVYFKKKKIL